MKRLFLFLTVAAAVCCAACSDDPEVAESNLSLLEDNVTFDMFGGRSVLEITADSPWTVSCDDDWCRTNVAEGSHTKKIVLTVDQSFLPEERTTAVRFYAAGEEKHTVTVTQEKFEPILVLAENGADITVYGAGSEPALNLRASVAWKIEGATDWCAVSQSEGTKSSVVKLLLTDDGEGVRPRSATLTVFSEMEGVEPQQVTVVQRSTGANTVVVRAGETRAFPARRTDGAYVKGVAADWVWTTDAELLSGLDYDASRNEITCTAAKSKQGSGLVALFDAEGAVVWSWLVWVVDKMPSDVTVGGIAWQDRNVGAEYHSTDPKACVQVIKEIRKLYETEIPIFAICLGHQLMALATGADTFKLKYGHRGGNHPVKDMETGRVYISSQNHGYAVDPESLDPQVAVPAFTNVNDGTNEGLKYVGKNIFTVQYHPEACPGPQDSSYLFDRFLKMMEEKKNA